MIPIRVPAAAVLLLLPAPPSLASERELEEAPPPSSAEEIRTPIERIFPPLPEERPPLIPWIGGQLDGLSPFFADTRLEARFRTYYLRQDRAESPAVDQTSEAWAMGGSIAYRSGWARDLLQLQVEGFTSQRIYGPNGRGGSLLLEPVNDSLSVLGIANARLRWRDVVVTGYRQYLDLPFVNRRDDRMIPNTFEGVTLEKPEGRLTGLVGYAWGAKLRDSDEFQSFTDALGLPKDRGLAYASAVWNPDDPYNAGVFLGVVPDVLTTLYLEGGLGRGLVSGSQLRVDGQLTFRWENGDDLLGPELDDTWSAAVRSSASRSGAVFRLGFSMTGPGSSAASFFGTSPSYVDLMQRTFVAADEKAILLSASYDFSELGIPGLTAIANAVAAFDGEREGRHRDARELDVTLDYRVGSGLLESFWLRVRGSVLWEEDRDRYGTDVRVILRYDFPVI